MWLIPLVDALINNINNLNHLCRCVRVGDSVVILLFFLLLVQRRDLAPQSVLLSVSQSSPAPRFITRPPYALLLIFQRRSPAPHLLCSFSNPP